MNTTPFTKAELDRMATTKSRVWELKHKAAAFKATEAAKRGKRAEAAREWLSAYRTDCAAHGVEPVA